MKDAISKNEIVSKKIAFKERQGKNTKRNNTAETIVCKRNCQYFSKENITCNRNCQYSSKETIISNRSCQCVLAKKM